MQALLEQSTKEARRLEKEKEAKEKAEWEENWNRPVAPLVIETASEKLSEDAPSASVTVPDAPPVPNNNRLLKDFKLPGIVVAEVVDGLIAPGKTPQSAGAKAKHDFSIADMANFMKSHKN